MMKKALSLMAAYTLLTWTAQVQAQTYTLTPVDVAVVNALAQDDIDQCLRGDNTSLLCRMTLMLRREGGPIEKVVSSEQWKTTPLEDPDASTRLIEMNPTMTSWKGGVMTWATPDVTLTMARRVFPKAGGEVVVCNAKTLTHCEPLSTYTTRFLGLAKDLTTKPLDSTKPIDLNSIKGRMGMSALFFSWLAPEDWKAKCLEGHCDFEAAQSWMQKPKKDLDPIVLKISQYINRPKKHK